MNLLETNQLPSSLISRTRHALSSGALVSIPTQSVQIRDHELPFVLRVLSRNKERQAAATLTADGSAPTGKTNPFLPYEQDLYVGHFNDNYVCLLNKFNVVPNHFLIVTATYQEQNQLLTPQDFEVSLQVLKELPGLVFFNGGKLAGASQKHKHLQAIPFSEASAPEFPDRLLVCPLYDVLTQTSSQQVQSPELPFLHRLKVDYSPDPDALHQTYLQWVQELGIANDPQSLPGAYNLLLTREWFMIVPRKQEHFAGMSVNALGFAGTLLARTPEQLQQIQETGPLHLLSRVTFPQQPG
ncbi:hypothetical protein BTA51_06130 [Hahella sp. CCB-MM4]|uniref:ATP adenylyltransferase family protein n=1 Tax=Hahella sp. (strain CCB-MM4) TaxID=1926491 RepID=UPI000B9A897E|nr:DUF4922 domain-containing protein [Hahella sp. CCB-MM4]OZG74573.1 hypothetical protein BTA51_06130 [Hahella sp. CCB-MM4]